mmetsp:Transcript_12177/g.22022  ORF Transcript_12177/g.22022 Transcript_12177/m.22022 type:complete len:347 (-) Transcript_12177:397-1437(-)|eukprot:CAMPEP_0182442948 /NCGR_PEP_ID=MMETSP1172-20130603/1801_1 /TAXON_ID=708627 /ORGANISM="Timspurckia oligopyrenoides, Strain CCMP3278" /LENGTH=346 /DNA_ID=CAMNT_0024638055 /DNA_START=1008 /DNA_END=2048 /DNA_ORIENTATION=+
MECIVFGADENEKKALNHALEKELELKSKSASLLQLVFAPRAELFGQSALQTLCSRAHAVSISQSDHLSSSQIKALHDCGVQLIALRHPSVSDTSLELDLLRDLKIQLARAPPVSAASLAEYTVALILNAAKGISVSSHRVAVGDLRVDGIIGFELAGKTVGFVGTGKVGILVARILRVFGCKVLAYDVTESSFMKDLGGEYVALETLWSRSDIITLHAPLVSATHHMVDKAAIDQMKTGVLLVNTSRGGLINPEAVLRGVESGKIGALAIDVFDCESADALGNDHGTKPIPDHVLRSLVAMPNVTLTPKLSTRTQENIQAIAQATISSLVQFSAGDAITHAVDLG